MDAIINVIAAVMQRLMATSGAESTVAAANIFVGQTEAPLLTRKFLPAMTMAEIHSIMTCGFATIAGGVFAAFVSMGINAQALLTASVMNAPTALAVSKLVYPESEIPVTSIEYQNFQKEEEKRKAQELKRAELAANQQAALETGAHNPTEHQSADAWDDNQDIKWLEAVRAERGPDIDAGDQAYNFLHAAANGASSGWAMCGAIVAMLIAFIALFALLNDIVNYFGTLVNLPGLTFETIFGYVFFPFAWLMGIPAAECLYAGRLLATKMFLNEFVAYAQLASDIANQGQPGVPTVSPRTELIMTYALCSCKCPIQSVNNL
jgi:CNT family concentrative nucleoside transporter